MFTTGILFAEDAVKPTAEQTRLLNETSLIRFPVENEIAKVIPIPKKEGNAAEYYKMLEVLYKEDIANLASGAVKPDAKGIDVIFKASQYVSCQLVPTAYPSLEYLPINMPNITIHFAYLQAMLDRAEAYRKNNQHDFAVRTYQAILTWGLHYINDRSTVLIYLFGLLTLEKGLAAYYDYNFKLAKLDASNLINQVRENTVQSSIRFLSMKIGHYLGKLTNYDSIYALQKVALEDPEPMWRKEAAVRLGLLRHGAPIRDTRIVENLEANAQLQLIAHNTLLKMAETDADPSIRMLAQWCITSLTPAIYVEFTQQQLSSLNPIRKPAD